MAIEVCTTGARLRKDWNVGVRYAYVIFGTCVPYAYFIIIYAQHWAMVSYVRLGIFRYSVPRICLLPTVTVWCRPGVCHLIIATSRHAALRRDCLYPPAHPSGNPFILGSKGQRSRSRVTKKHCRRASLHSGECWLLLVVIMSTSCRFSELAWTKGKGDNDEPTRK